MTTRFQSRCGLRGGASAFTLLELLIATAVGALVLLVINATFFSALRLHNGTHERIDRDLELERALGVIRGDLAGIMLPGGKNGMIGQLQSDTFASGAVDVVDGERITPEIYTTSGRVDGWSPFGEAQSVAYYLAPDAKGGPEKSLVRAVTRNLLPVQEPDTEQQTLLNDVISAAVSYYDGSGWVDTWDSEATSTMPGAIRFSVVLARHDANPNAATNPPAPVEIVVPVMVMTSTSAQEVVAAATEGTGS